MANKKNPALDYSMPPKTLDDHPFYGLKMDDEQKAFRDLIWNDEKLIIFCDAASGTGKTTIATLTANLLCLYGKYEGIVYVAAPVQEHKLGFLPGSANEKAEPYFEPFMQAALRANINPYMHISQKATPDAQKEGSNYIECLTHVFLRGVNFTNKVVILDESQNFSVCDLKKTLTRCADNAKVIVIGHTGQCDLVTPDASGFSRYIEHFDGDDRCAVCKLSKNYRGWISSHADSLQD